ncbi:circadian clock-controlled protein daywake isoform X1 [Pieris rapae]|uniref:circadian clock-controlled protein daywake isoform X1 n=1 Tax=Pieris rapae TaxID=64459 RepID=UPI001E27A4E3|nr:circadian clock-controlled protein daywake isoform X1 [Pieris rapae]
MLRCAVRYLHSHDMFRLLCLAVAFCCTLDARAATLPSFLRACSASDPNLSQCVEKVIAVGGGKFAKGIPELGIASLDPVHLGRVVVDNPALKLTFDDTVVTGLGDFVVNSFKIDTEKGKATLDFTANVTLKAHYDMDGQVLILPIRGNGDAKIKITNLNIVIKYDYKTVDGYWTVTGYKDSYNMDRAHFKFTNLFNGNKELADTTVKFANQNWRLIMQDIAPPAIEHVVQKCVDEVNKLFKAVSATDLLAA